MAVRFQLVIDCAYADRLARFSAAALGYELAPPPPASRPGTTTTATSGYLRRSLPTVQTGSVTPKATGRAFGSMWSPRPRSSRTDCTSTSTPAASGRIPSRPQTAGRREARRLVELGATTVGALMEDGILDHYAVGMKDPEGNEFDIN